MEYSTALRFPRTVISSPSGNSAIRYGYRTRRRKNRLAFSRVFRVCDLGDVLTGRHTGVVRRRACGMPATARKYAPSRGSALRGRFSPDGTQVVTAGGVKSAQLWEARTGERIRNLLGHTEFVFNAAFSSASARALSTIPPAGPSRTSIRWAGERASRTTRRARAPPASIRSGAAVRRSTMAPGGVWRRSPRS